MCLALNRLIHYCKECNKAMCRACDMSTGKCRRHANKVVPIKEQVKVTQQHLQQVMEECTQIGDKYDRNKQKIDRECTSMNTIGCIQSRLDAHVALLMSKIKTEHQALSEELGCKRKEINNTSSLARKCETMLRELNKAVASAKINDVMEQLEVIPSLSQLIANIRKCLTSLEKYSVSVTAPEFTELNNLKVGQLVYKDNNNSFHTIQNKLSKNIKKITHSVPKENCRMLILPLIVAFAAVFVLFPRTSYPWTNTDIRMTSKGRYMGSINKEGKALQLHKWKNIQVPHIDTKTTKTSMCFTTKGDIAIHDGFNVVILNIHSHNVLASRTARDMLNFSDNEMVQLALGVHVYGENGLAVVVMYESTFTVLILDDLNLQVKQTIQIGTNHNNIKIRMRKLHSFAVMGDKFAVAFESIEYQFDIGVFSSKGEYVSRFGSNFALFDLERPEDEVTIEIGADNENIFVPIRMNNAFYIFRADGTLVKTLHINGVADSMTILENELLIASSYAFATVTSVNLTDYSVVNNNIRLKKRPYCSIAAQNENVALTNDEGLVIFRTNISTRPNGTM